MEDPSARSVARVYAVALLDAAKATNVSMDDVLGELRSFLDDVLTPNPGFERLLLSTATTLDDKERLIDRVLGTRGTPLVVNFLRVLARHGRLDLVRTVWDVAVREQELRSGRRRVRVVSAVPLSAQAEEAITARLGAALAAEPILETQVDPKLLGGLVIRVGDTVYDGSVRNRMKQLRARLRERCLNEVQRGRDRFSHPEGN